MTRERWKRCIVLAALALTGCAGSTQVLCQRDPATGLSQCQPTSSSAGDALITAGLAGGVYAVTGCTVNGCQLPDYCNAKTKRCEPIRCNETNPCPAGYKCMLDTKLCR